MRPPCPLLIVFGAALFVLFTAAAAQESAEALYRNARKAESIRNFKAALDGYDKVIALDMEYKDAFERWEDCLELSEWQEELEGEPGAADLVRLGEVFLELGRIEEERACYEEAIRTDPGYPEGHGHLALLFYTTRQGTIADVVPAVVRFLEASPNRERLQKALRDFQVHGRIRTLRILLRGQLAEAARLEEAEEWRKAADLLEGEAKETVPDVFHTWLYTESGKLRLSGGDEKGARKAFEKALGHVNCASSIEARLGLARLDLETGKSESALEHLCEAVKEGSSACLMIAGERDGAFKPLFESPDEGIRRKVEELADQERGDEPIRARIRKALERAGREKKKVLLHFYGPFCPYVMMMEERLAHPRVQELIEERYIHLRVDMGAMHRAMTIDREYGEVFNYYGVPCFLILKPDGSVQKAQPCNEELMGAPHRAYDVEKILDRLGHAADVDY